MFILLLFLILLEYYFVIVCIWFIRGAFFLLDTRIHFSFAFIVWIVTNATVKQCLLSLFTVSMYVSPQRLVIHLSASLSIVPHALFIMDIVFVFNDFILNISISRSLYHHSFFIAYINMFHLRELLHRFGVIIF